MGQGGRGNFSTYGRFRDSLMDLDAEASNTAASDVHIVHSVSKLDTLAGVAIKYGVEVADIKRLNGLTTDLQMFARKSLRIPLPGRHPPSDQLLIAGHSNSDPQPRLGKHPFTTLNDSIAPQKTEEKKKLSPAMGLLRGYYGLHKNEGDGTEMEVYRSDNGYQSEDEPFTPREQVPKPSPKSQESNNMNTFNSMVNMAREFVVNEVEKHIVRRRPKGEYGDSKGLSEDSRGFSGDSKGFRSTVPRPKSKLGVEVEVDCPATVRALVFNSGGKSEASKGGKGYNVMEEFIFKLKKSPSTPNLQDDKFGTRGDSTESVTIPLLDTLTRRSKTALD